MGQFYAGEFGTTYPDMSEMGNFIPQIAFDGGLEKLLTKIDVDTVYFSRFLSGLVDINPQNAPNLYFSAESSYRDPETRLLPRFGRYIHANNTLITYVGSVIDQVNKQTDRTTGLPLGSEARNDLASRLASDSQLHEASHWVDDKVMGPEGVREETRRYVETRFPMSLSLRVMSRVKVADADNVASEIRDTTIKRILLDMDFETYVASPKEQRARALSASELAGFDVIGSYPAQLVLR